MNNNKVFHTRDGTRDKGRDYEKILCVYYSILLENNPEVKDFWITSNDRRYGDFDDVVLHVQYHDGNEEVFCIQSKHKQNTNKITSDSFSAPSGDFSVLKYFKSYEEIKTAVNLDNVKFVIFTNRIFEQDSCEIKVSDKSKKIDDRITISKADKNDASIFLNGSLHTFAGNGTIGNEDFEKYINRLSLLTSQLNCEETKNKASELFKKHYGSSEEVYKIYSESISNWYLSDTKTKTVLSKSLIRLKLGEALLKEFSLTSDVELVDQECNDFEKAVLNFDVTIISELKRNLKFQKCADAKDISLVFEEKGCEDNMKSLWRIGKI